MNKLNVWLLCTILALVAALFFTIHQSNQMEEKWKVAMGNIKAYDIELSKSKASNAAYQFTIEQLNYLQDSIVEELNKTRKELKVKDKNLKALQYSSSSFSKSDTIVLKDTFLINASASIDTVIGDEWYQIKLGLKYPSTIAVEPTFKSEKHIVIHSKKETVNPPKKFFLFRWFQKKHLVLEVDVVEKNPYVKNEQNKYVEIIK